MRGFLMLCVLLPLTGCLAGAANGRSTTSVVRDDGINPVQRTTYTSENSGSYVGGGMPFGIVGGGGYGYGGGYATVTGPSCVLHPDSCAVIQTATVVQPVTVISNGGGDAGTYGGADTSDLEARIERLETAVPKLAGGTILSLRQSCYAIMKDPGVIADAAEREKIVAGCTKVLNANPKAADKAEEN